MLLVYFVLASLAVGLLRRRRRGLGQVNSIPLAAPWLPIAAFLLEAAIGPLSGWVGPTTALWLTVPAQYLLLGVFLLLNRRLSSSIPLALGTVCNLLVIGTNGWRMPVSSRIFDLPHLTAAAERIASGELAEYVVAGPQTRLLWLGDVIHFSWVPGMAFASIGDFLLGIGIFWMIQQLMVPKEVPEAASFPEHSSNIV